MISEHTIVLLVSAFALLAAMFLVGRFNGQKRRGAEELDIESLKKARIEEQQRYEAQIKSIREEKENLIKQALRAQESIDHWDSVKSDHKAIDKMKQDLDEFEKHESDRIDKLETRRVEAARRLQAVQAILDQYPSEMLQDGENWQDLLDERKQAYDEIEKEIKKAKEKLNNVEEAKNKLESEMLELEKNLEKKNKELNQFAKKLEETKGAIAEAERILKTKELVSDTTIQFPSDSLNVKIEEMPATTAKKRNKLSAFRNLPDCLKEFESPLDAVEKEEDILLEFKDALENVGFEYHDRIIKAFHTALKVNDLSPLTVLSGLSGTGKSQLPRVYSQFFGINFLHVPVEPGWDSPQDILGFYDFVAEQYRPTDRARALGFFDSEFNRRVIKSKYDWTERMLIILLDEMNLARTEYYFSEFLSRLEMRGPRNTSGKTEKSKRDAQIAIDLPYTKKERPEQLYIPHNVLWVGTLNEDETTQTLSDKVLDRANSIRFAPPSPSTLVKHRTAPETTITPSVGFLPYKHWLTWSKRKKNSQDQINATLEELAIHMKGAGRGFGYRITQSIQAYVDRYPDDNWKIPMIDQINMRLLPKLAGTELADCQDALNKIKDLCEIDLSDEKFADALDQSVANSQLTQTFTWPGYTYE